MRCTTGTSSASSSAATRPGRHRKCVVVLDTNALFLPFGSALRIETEVDRLVGPAEIVVPSSVLGELGRLEARDVAGARAAIALARRFRTYRARGRGDAAVREAARSLRAWVLTADRSLRESLLREGTPVLYPRDRSRLAAFDGRAKGTVKSGAKVRRRRTLRTVHDDRRRPDAPAPQP